MSYSYERAEQRRRPSGPTGGRNSYGHWVPLALTVTAATIGLIAWVWNEHSDDGETNSGNDSHNESQEGRVPGSTPGYSQNAPSGAPSGYPPNAQPGAPPFQQGPPGEFSRSTGNDNGTYTDNSVMARVSGALRRTPSPQQIYDGASKKMAAGMAAAGAVVGGALSSIREEDKEEYPDHSRWSQEAESSKSASGGQAVSQSTISSTTDKAVRKSSPPNRYHANVKRKTVGIVVSAETSYLDSHDDELSSILSHLPAHLDPSTTRLYILIYSPDLKQHPLSSADGGRNPGSIASSYSNIGTEEMRTPKEELDRPLSSVDPNPTHSSSSGANTPNTPALSATASPAFNSMYSQAQKLVEKDNMILPFTTTTGYVHLLRHLSPDIVYVQESLSGTDGDAISHMTSWVSQVVVVVGAEGGHGGLIDTEDDEGHNDDQTDKWWQSSDRVGLGKGIDVVEGIRIGEDWTRRVQGQE